jgi:hypothetical protein
MRTYLLTAALLAALSACGTDERPDAKRADSATNDSQQVQSGVVQGSSAPTHDEPGGGSGTAAAERQESTTGTAPAPQANPDPSKEKTPSPP